MQMNSFHFGLFKILGFILEYTLGEMMSSPIKLGLVVEETKDYKHCKSILKVFSPERVCCTNLQSSRE